MSGIHHATGPIAVSYTHLDVYKRQGLENAWYSTQGDNQVTFRNIPHGNYVFKVKTRFRNQESVSYTHLLSTPLASPVLGPAAFKRQ